MAEVAVTVETIDKVEEHPCSDRLDLVKIRGYQTATTRGHFQPGEKVYFFPPGVLLPETIADRLEVKKFLKYAHWPGMGEKTQCRVGSVMIRGLPSHGFCAKVEVDANPPLVGSDVSEKFGALKYVPPSRIETKDALPDIEQFHRFTEVQDIRRYPNVFIPDERVVVTEKLHGTQCRMGIIHHNNGREYSLYAGSRDVRLKSSSPYWNFFTREVMDFLLSASHGHTRDVMLFGEIIGPGIQDMEYGLSKPAFRVFDAAANREYFHYDELVALCQNSCLPLVPLLYKGPFSDEVVEACTYAKTTMPVTEGFSGREGCVIRPVREQFSEELRGRKILKSIAATYEEREDAEDNQ